LSYCTASFIYVDHIVFAESSWTKSEGVVRKSGIVCFSTHYLRCQPVSRGKEGIALYVEKIPPFPSELAGSLYGGGRDEVRKDR
jgi:hypothetical protein